MPPSRGDALAGFEQRILDVLPLQIAVFDADARFVYISPSAIADAATRDAAIGRTNEEYFKERGLDAATGRHRDEQIRTVARTRTAAELRESFVTRGGQVRHFLRRHTPLLDDSGDVRFVLGDGVDETDAVLARKALEETAARAQELNRAKGRFLAGVSHEVRTPLSAIIAALHLLDGAPLDAPHRAFLESARESAAALLGLLNNVLDISRIGSGEIGLSREPFAPERALRDIVAASGPAAALKTLELRCEIEGPLPPIVIGDRLRLRQVVGNLIGNAIKFTDRGEVVVRVRASPVESPGASREGEPGSREEAGPCRVEISVSDTGRGIAISEIPTIFDRFTQAGSTASADPPGTGLGLAIVKELVELQGGTVSVVSVPAQGSRFTVTLPFDTSKAGTEPSPSGAPDSLALSGCRVAIAEDNPVIRKLVSTIIERAGGTAEELANGAILLERLAEPPPIDLVIVDIQMPVLDGVAATRRIRADLGLGARDLPVVALTAAAMVQDREAILAAGANDFIVKPFDPRELVARIRSAWRASQHSES